MYLLYNLGRHIVRVDGASRQLVIENSKTPMPYAQAAELAARSARSDSENLQRRLRFQPMGTPIEENR
jgi:hypothetical protein